MKNMKPTTRTEWKDLAMAAAEALSQLDRNSSIARDVFAAETFDVVSADMRRDQTCEKRR